MAEMETLPMFEMQPETPAPEPEKLSEQRRRTIRQLALLKAGRHPLQPIALVPLRLHPDAPPADDRKAPGPRCGSCRFRGTWGAHSFPKCLRGEGEPLAAHSAASDVRSWWPGCSYWEAAS